MVFIGMLFDVDRVVPSRKALVFSTVEGVFAEEELVVVAAVELAFVAADDEGVSAFVAFPRA